VERTASTNLPRAAIVSPNEDDDDRDNHIKLITEKYKEIILLDGQVFAS